jgi:hypothetical protein
MARKFLTPIDLNKLELRNAVIQNLGIAPENPIEGQIYYDTVDDKIKVYTNNSWVNVGSTIEEIEDMVADLIEAGDGIDVTYTDNSASAGILTISNTGILSLAGTANEILVNGSTAAVNSASVILSLPDTINANTTGNAATASQLETPRTIALEGDVVGSVVFSGSSSVSINTTIQPDSVQLGTDTTGNYVQGIFGTANEIVVTGSGGESASVTVGLPANVTIANDLTVGGSLTVSGSTTFLNVETVQIEDNILLLNSGAAGNPVLNAGIEVNRGASANVSLVWDESDDEWQLTNDGTYYHKIARTAAANVGNNSANSFVINHNLGTRDVKVQIYDNATYETVEADVARTTINSVTVTFGIVPGVDAYRVVISG